jgi:hypothetical protein
MRIILAAMLIIWIATSTELQYVSDLQPTENMTLVKNLRDILDDGSYNNTYQEGVFDCMDSCKITHDVLAQHGYEAVFIARLVPKNSSEESHIWLAVPDGDGRYAFIETTLFAFGVSGLGGVVIPEDVRAMGYDRGYIVRDQIPNCGMWAR